MITHIINFVVFCTGSGRLFFTIFSLKHQCKASNIISVVVLSDGTDEYAMNRLLHQIFDCKIDSTGKICSLVKEFASRTFDMKEEVLFYFHPHSKQYFVPAWIIFYSHSNFYLRH